MFAKLLKHDCKAMFRHWWIAAASSVLLAIIAGICLNIVTVSYTTHLTIQAVAYILLIFSIIAIFFFPTLAAILMFRYFNKNFFHDEGYLTFTLPVSKTALLSSKLVTGTIFAVFSTIVFGLDLILIAIINGEYLSDIRYLMFKWVPNYLYEDLSMAITTIVINFAILAAIATSTAFIFLCITLANIIAKKRKLLVGLGIFYAIQMVLVIFARTVISSGALDLMCREAKKFDIYQPFTALAILAVIVILGAAIYLINLYLLDKKLNLE